MSYSVESLSLEIFENEFDSDTDINSQVRISGWLKANIGRLNSQLHTAFDDDFSVPTDKDYEFGHEEAAIYTLMYMKNYYSKAARQSLLGKNINSSAVTSVTGMTEWTRIQEGDTIIERRPLYTSSSSSNVSEKYSDLMSSTDRDLKSLITKYNIYGAEPRQVSGSDGD